MEFWGQSNLRGNTPRKKTADPEFLRSAKVNAEEIGERDEMQGARRAAAETYLADRRGSEHRVTQQLARAAIC